MSDEKELLISELDELRKSILDKNYTEEVLVAEIIKIRDIIKQVVD